MSQSMKKLAAVFDDAALAHRLVMNMGYFEGYDIPPLKRTIARLLGERDRLYSPNTPYVQMYAAAPYFGQGENALRPEMGALMDMAKVEAARLIFAAPVVALDAGIICNPDTSWRDQQLAESANVSPTTALYLQDAANRALIRERFPRAKLSAKRFAAVLAPSEVAYKRLPRELLAKDTPRAVQLTALRRMCSPQV